MKCTKEFAAAFYPLIGSREWEAGSDGVLEAKFYRISLYSAEDTSHMLMELTEQEAGVIARLGKLSKIYSKGVPSCPSLEIEVAE
uniref:Uncharacterized protein n=1 Tax=viral metagenome TaxID=1070528 RepID=A0A6M3K7T4_9ZZZZ